MRLLPLLVVAFAIATSRLMPGSAQPSGSAGNCSSADCGFDGILKSEKILITRKDGTKFGIWIEPGDTIAILERRIYEIAGVHWKRQRLSIGDYYVEHSYLLTNYKDKVDKADSFATLDIWPGDGINPTKFCVITPGGDEILVSTRLSNSVASLKDTLAQSTGVPREQQRLIVKGKELVDERQLLEYDIWEGTGVRMGTPIETCLGVTIKIAIQTLSEATIPIEIDLSEKVANLREKIQELTGAPTFVQLILFDGMTLSDPDYLCDYGLETGSYVYLVLISQQLNLEFIEKLQEVVPPRHHAPIFHEASDAVDDNSRVAIYKDRRNWASNEFRRHPEVIFGWLNPVAFVEPNPDDRDELERARMRLNFIFRPDLWESIALPAQYRIANILESYRRATKYKVKRPGLHLGSTFDPRQSLGANINNYAPDAFNDQELMRLFELIERIREQLASDRMTGKVTLSCARQRVMNYELLRVYLEAMVGFQLANENYHPAENEECAMCRDSLQAGPSLKLSCDHAYHIDCALGWIMELRKEPHQNKKSACPYCQYPFRFGFETCVTHKLD